MEMLVKDCSNLNHELVPIMPLADAIPMNSPMDGGLLPPLSHFHLHHQQSQHSQLVPIQIQQTQPAIMSSLGAPMTTMASCSTTTTTVVSMGEPSAASMGMEDEQPSHIIPMMMVADPSNSGGGGSCLTCLPELPETEDYEEEGGVVGGAHGHEETDCNAGLGDQQQHNQNHHHRSVMCDGTMTAN